MHEEDCRLPSLDWLIKTYQTIPNPNPLVQIKPLTPLRDLPMPNTAQPTTSSNIDYANHPQKPPYSYSQLIIQAMKHFGGQKVLLTDIYNFIRDRYAWYRLCDPSWQNSIRHNLSLNKQFIKIPRSPGDKGKGSYWRLDFSMIKNGILKSRKPSTREKKPVSKCRAKVTAAETPQVNPAILTFLKENSETISDSIAAHSTSSSSTRSSPQIMEISVDDGGLASEENYNDPMHCDFSTFTDEFSNDYDPNLEFSSFFTDVEYSPSMDLVPEGSGYTVPDSGQSAMRMQNSWTPLENGNCYNNYTTTVTGPNEVLMNRDELSETLLESDAHPWQDINFSFTDDNLLFDTEL